MNKNQGKNEEMKDEGQFGNLGLGPELTKSEEKDNLGPGPELTKSEEKDNLGPGPKLTKLTGPKIFKKVWNIFMKIVTILIAIVSMIIIVQKVTNNNQSFFGYRIFRVQTGSMIPKYQIGDVILVKERNIDKIKVGDDVTYLGKEGATKGILITHRVKDIEEIDGQLAFHTQGIANNLEDPIVYGDQINGVVQFKMFFLTLICKMLNNKYIFYFCGVLPLTIYVFFRVFKGSREKYEKRIEKN